MTARIHHYVPQLYLKGFCRDSQRPKLFVIDAVAKRAFNTSPRNVAAERDFNRVEVEGTSPDALEASFSGFEGEAAAALERISERRSFRDPADRLPIVNLLGLMALRNPRRRETFNDFQARVAKMIMQLALATPERWAAQVAGAKASGFMKPDADADYERMKAFFEGGKYKIETVREWHIALELSTFDKLLPFLFQRKWTLLKADPDSGGFITSDHPVCLMWSEPHQPGGFHGPGFGLANTEVLFPLTSELALLGSFEGADAEMDANIFVVAECNATIIGYAERQFYAAHESFAYLRRGSDPCALGKELLTDGSFVRPRRKQGNG